MTDFERMPHCKCAFYMEPETGAYRHAPHKDCPVHVPQPAHDPQLDRFAPLPEHDPQLDRFAPLPVPGYTTQSTDNVGRVKLNKFAEERVLRLIDEHRANPAYDQRLVALAHTHIQDAFMWLNRAVFKPERVKLPEDDNVENRLTVAKELDPQLFASADLGYARELLRINPTMSAVEALTGSRDRK